MAEPANFVAALQEGRRESLEDRLARLQTAAEAEHDPDAQVMLPAGESTALVLLCDWAQSGEERNVNSVLELMRCLLDLGAGAATARRRDGKTPLHVVAKGPADGEADELLPIVRLLLAEGGAKSVLALDVKDNETPLHVAAGAASAGVVQAMLTTLAASAETAVDGAAADGSAFPLLERICEPASSTPFHFAANCGRLENLRLLAEEDPRHQLVHRLSQGKFSPLHSASGGWGQAPCVEFLLRDCAAPPAVIDATEDYNDRTALFMAAEENGSLEIARLLVEAGADVTLKSRGRTALDIAEEKGHADVAEYLRSLGSA
jgi:ankyrin repeat protein